MIDVSHAWQHETAWKNMALKTPRRSSWSGGIDWRMTQNESRMLDVLVLLHPEGSEGFQQRTAVVTYLYQKLPCHQHRGWVRVREQRERGKAEVMGTTYRSHCRVYEGVMISVIFLMQIEKHWTSWMSCGRVYQARIPSYWLDHRICWLLSLGIVETGFRRNWIQDLEDNLYCFCILALHVSGLAFFSGRLSSRGHTDDTCSSGLLPWQPCECSRETVTSSMALPPWRRPISSDLGS